MFNRVGILGHPLRPATGEICEQVAQSLRRRGIDFWERRTWEPGTVGSLVEGSDLVIAIGGDGAMLRAARVCSSANVPVFGINAGRLGFLTEISPAEWEVSLDALLAGNFWIEARMMIRSELWREGESLCSVFALNDVVIGRGAVAKSVLLETYIDDGWATTYNADALIIATPTGSTAYALAVGGPILPPQLKNILVVPVAPHLSLDRAVVLSEGAVVEVVIVAIQGGAVLTVDGESVAELQEGDSVEVRANDALSRFVRLRERNYFYRSLLGRMEPRVNSGTSADGHLRRAVTRKS